MVIGIITTAIKIASKVYKYRNQIYQVASAQDRAIKSAFVGTKISKASQYGWRTGAAAGGLIGTLINKDADDSPGNAIQKTPSKQYPTRPSNQARRGQARSYSSRYGRRDQSYSERRRANYCRNGPSRNRQYG